MPHIFPCIFTGIADKVFKTLEKDEKLSCAEFADKLDGIIRSGTIGHIRRGFSYMTAEDWLDITLNAVCGCMGILPAPEYRMVSQLSEAITIYSSR